MMNAFLNIRWKLPSKVFGSLTITNGFTDSYLNSAYLLWTLSFLDHMLTVEKDLGVTVLISAFKW